MCPGTILDLGCARKWMNGRKLMWWMARAAFPTASESLCGFPQSLVMKNCSWIHTQQWDVYNLYDVFEDNTAKRPNYKWFPLDHKCFCGLSWIIARGFLAKAGIETCKVFPHEFYCKVHWARKVSGRLERVTGGVNYREVSRRPRGIRKKCKKLCVCHDGYKEETGKRGM